MSSTDTRLTPDVVAKFALVAVANKLEEGWIAPFPFLPLLYCNQYMPTITKRYVIKGAIFDFTIHNVPSHLRILDWQTALVLT